MNSRKASRLVNHLPPQRPARSLTFSPSGPLQPTRIQRSNVENPGFAPLRPRGSNWPASVKEMVVSVEGSITAVLRGDRRTAYRDVGNVLRAGYERGTKDVANYANAASQMTPSPVPSPRNLIVPGAIASLRERIVTFNLRGSLNGSGPVAGHPAASKASITSIWFLAGFPV